MFGRFKMIQMVRNKKAAALRKSRGVTGRITALNVLYREEILQEPLKKGFGPDAFRPCATSSVVLCSGLKLNSKGFCIICFNCCQKAKKSHRINSGMFAALLH